MARTRGGGMISGMSGRPLRNGIKSRAAAECGRGRISQRRQQQNEVQQRQYASAVRDPVHAAATVNDGRPRDDTPTQGFQRGGNSSITPAGSYSLAELDSAFPLSRGARRTRKRAEIGVAEFEIGEFPVTAMSMDGLSRKVSAIGEGPNGRVDEHDDVFGSLFEDDNDHDGVEDVVEAVVGWHGVKGGVLTSAGLASPSPSSSTHRCPRVGDQDQDQSSHHPQQRSSVQARQGRELSHEAAKPSVWRMLYVDPDVADPKLVARRLENVASMALQCACVFDVASDIVQTLSDVRGDTMSIYQGVFINENLRRHRKSAQSIEGKHLARFLRQAGMSGARMILLVSGDVQFDTADAGAHGLNAVLRKPFTRDGFCDILRGIYLSNDGDQPFPIAADTTGDRSPTLHDAQLPRSQASHPSHSMSSPGRPAAARSACATCGSHKLQLQHNHHVHGHGQWSASGMPTALDTRFVSALDRHLTVSAEAAAVAAAAAHHGNRMTALTRPSYPDCLGFTPFPSAMLQRLNRYSMMSGFARQPIMAGLMGQGNRRYAKIAPREDDEQHTPATAEPDPPQELHADDVDTAASGDCPTTTTTARTAGPSAEHDDLQGPHTGIEPFDKERCDDELGKASTGKTADAAISSSAVPDAGAAQGDSHPSVTERRDPLLAHDSAII